MTEKRFRYYETSEDTQIWDSQTNAFYDDFDLDKITECLNNLHEENEQLKQFKEKVFVLLDKKIKHYEHKPFSAPVSQLMSVNFDYDVDRLARLSELQDLEKELKE